MWESALAHPRRPCGTCRVCIHRSSRRCIPPAPAHTVRSHIRSAHRIPLLAALQMHHMDLWRRERFWRSTLMTVYILGWTIYLKCIILLTSWCFIIIIEGQRAVRRPKVIFRADLVLLNWASNQSILTIWPTGITRLTDITHSCIGSWMTVKKKEFCFHLFFFVSQWLCKNIITGQSDHVRQSKRNSYTESALLKVTFDVNRHST